MSADGTLNAGDTIRFIWDEEMASSTIATTLTVTLAGSPTVVAGATVNPAVGVTDKASNADITGEATGEALPTVVQVS